MPSPHLAAHAHGAPCLVRPQLKISGGGKHPHGSPLHGAAPRHHLPIRARGRRSQLARRHVGTRACDHSRVPDGRHRQHRCRRGTEGCYLHGLISFVCALYGACGGCDGARDGAWCHQGGTFGASNSDCAGTSGGGGGRWRVRGGGGGAASIGIRQLALSSKPVGSFHSGGGATPPLR